MTKSGQNTKTEQDSESRARAYVMLVRCTTEKGCQRDNYFYELNESFTTQVDVTEEIWEKHVKPVEEREGRRLDALEICQLATPNFLEVLAPGDPANLPPSIAHQVANPPKPGQERAMSKPLFERIRETCQMLDHNKEHHWTEARKPAPVVVSSILGQQVNAEQIEAAAPGMERRAL